jgi:hypothetical protein
MINAAWRNLPTVHLADAIIQASTPRVHLVDATGRGELLRFVFCDKARKECIRTMQLPGLGAFCYANTAAIKSASGRCNVD